MAVEDPSTPTTDVLRRAAAELRAEQDPGWVSLGGSVIAAAKAAVRRSRPVLAQWPDLPGDDGGRLTVSDLVVRREVRRALAEVPACRVLRVGVELDGAVLTRLVAEVSVAYGTDAHLVAAAVRATAASTLDDLLGPGTRRVDVTVLDVDP